MPDLVGEAVDQVVTIEAKNRGMPHGILAPLYHAARAAAGGRPLTMLAAEQLVKSLKAGDTVFFLTGAGYPPAMPAGEDDGPPGVVSLARALYRGLGVVPVFICEEQHAAPIIAASQAAHLMVRPFEQARDHRLGAAIARAPIQQDAVNKWVDGLFAQMKPRFVISAERLGPGANGVIHYATGIPQPGVLDISRVVTKATEQGLPSIGIGDHGNEIGFGTIRDAVVRTMPNGERLATVIKTDLILPVMCSNWGCYGIEACLAFLLKRLDLIHRPADEERIVRACLDAGGLEAFYCTTEFIVDGLRGETSMALMQFLWDIVRKNLEKPDRGLAH
jgi:D-glutamate cyclase